MALNISEKFRNISRLTAILNTFARHGFKIEIQRAELGDLVDTDQEGKEDSNRSQESFAKRLAFAFEELGPTFIKLGQLLASREDLLPLDAIVEFKRLQDGAKPITYETLTEILQLQYHEDHTKIFKFIHRQPLGSASIGQVHLAELMDGSAVVLKVQRPGIESLIQTDISILKVLAGVAENTIPALKRLRVGQIIDELARSLRSELDYYKEGAITNKMHKTFLASEEIYVPQVLQDVSTQQVLCMEAIQGSKIHTVSQPEQRIRIVRSGVKAFLKMTFELGLFHADLHPGNFLLMENQKLAILDFGLSARVNTEDRLTLACLFLAIVNEDLETITKLFVDLTECQNDFERSKIEKDIGAILAEVNLTRFQSLKLGKLFMSLATTCARNNSPLRRELIMFFRGLMALEAFGKSMAPEFDIISEASHFARHFPRPKIDKHWLQQESLLMGRDLQALLRDLPRTLKILSKKAQHGQLRFIVNSRSLEKLTKEMDRASNRMSLSIILGALVLGSSIATYGKKGRLFDSVATLGLIGFGVAGLLGIWLVISIIRSGRYK